MKIAQFKFELEDGSPLILTYNLQDNSLTPKWIDVVNDRKTETPKPSKLETMFKGSKFPTDPLELKIINKTVADLENLMLKLNSIVNQINEYYDTPLPLFTSTTEIDHKILNYLHEEFERYGERHRMISAEGYRNQKGNPDVFPGNKFKVEFHQLWLDLNQWIHITEGAMADDDYPNFSCLIQYVPFKEQGAPITNEDKLFLDHDSKWGKLYLGYNTLGKDYMHSYVDDDKRVVTNDQVKVQQYLSSEVWLNFSKDYIDAPHKEYELNFYKWWKTLGDVPFPDISKLALGRYYLGEISFDQTFLDFHPVYEDWLVPNSDIRREWNLKVFSKIVKATGVKIIND
ncbi:hypothetical protein UFOVP181_224 [uncultured Caudovirales phage]|uniref:Uncharacterized protein n=1 Tax=uncultured Caudovirales phage TaxID=2100421 RepID=A0A6J5KUF4_9CAUD|nr:hypothetical protein UFOVP57_415 [uncultured Caudovirales phage]CAB5208869.1 hypothetical protein UFOVP181_224 [uncultured Caudovirales phage]